MIRCANRVDNAMIAITTITAMPRAEYLKLCLTITGLVQIILLILF